MQTSIPNNTVQRAESATRSNLITRHPLLCAILITYLIAWAVLIPEGLASQKILPVVIPPLLEIVAGWAPALAAIVVTGFLEGRIGIAALLRRFLIVRVSVWWYLIALFGIAAVILGGIGLFVLSGSPMPAIPALHIPLPTFVFVFVVSLVLGALFNTEEVLWRGFMLPRLQARHSALVAALIIAIPETILHLPYFINKNIAFYQNVGVVAFTLFGIAAAVLYAWLFNNTRGSLLIVTLAHASQNAWANLLSDDQAIPFYGSIAILSLCAVAVVVVFGAARLAHHSVAPAAAPAGETRASAARA